MDGLRGLAVLAVMAFHFGLPIANGGSVGVDVFFVVSGYIVTNTMIFRAGTDHQMRVFWVRRASRLLPVLIVVLSVVGLAWSIEGALARSESVALAAGLVMQSNIAVTFLGARSHALVHLWSLSVEFHYYIGIVVLMSFLMHRRRPGALRSRSTSAFLIALAAMVVVIRVGLLTSPNVTPTAVYFSSFTRADGLLLGTAIAFAPLSWLHRLGRQWVAPAAATALAAIILGSPRWFEQPTLSLAGLVTVASIATGLIVTSAVVERAPRLFELVLAWRPIAWVGERSYSVYLWHFPVGSALIAGNSEAFQGPIRFGVQMAASLCVGAISFGLIENPLRRLINERWATAPVLLPSTTAERSGIDLPVAVSTGIDARSGPSPSPFPTTIR